VSTSTSTRGKKKPARAAKRSSTKLPAALAANAARSSELRLQRMRAQAQEDIDLIRLKQTQIVDAFYEIGQALARLKAPGVAKSMGRAGFAELVEQDLQMSTTTAEKLVAIVTHVRRRDALRWGQEKSAALIELAKATSNPTDSASTLVLEKRVRLASGRVLDVEAARPTEIFEAAKEERLRRQSREKGPRRGRTTTPEERAIAKAIEKALHGAGIAGAKVAAVATKPGQVAEVRIEHVPMNRLKELGATILRAAGGK
jgi:hypothetical protein